MSTEKKFISLLYKSGTNLQICQRDEYYPKIHPCISDTPTRFKNEGSLAEYLQNSLFFVCQKFTLLCAKQSIERIKNKMQMISRQPQKW
jgi:hypothetical protein